MNAKFYVALATVACGIALTTPAMAERRDGESLTKVVSYADLNLNGAPGVRLPCRTIDGPANMRGFR